VDVELASTAPFRAAAEATFSGGQPRVGAAESNALTIRFAKQELKCHYNGIITREALEMARPENRSEARSVSLTLPEETFNYLVLLATLGKLGRTENEVATHILVREAYAMHQRGFHEQRVPAADQTP
jgi:hypothetical protein